MIITILSLFFSFTALAMNPAEIESAIQSQVSQRHPNPPANFWESLGPEALPVLKRLLTQSKSTYEQSWYIDGLSHFSDPQVGVFLQEWISKTDNAVMKKKMIAGLIRSQGDQAFDFVEPFLKDSDPHIRLAVAEGMKNNMQTPRAKERVAQYQGAEKETWITQQLNQPAPPVGGRVQVNAVVKDLPEKDWAGSWSGVYMTPSSTSAARLELNKAQSQWRAKIFLKKGSPIELKGEQIEVIYSKTDHHHWIEIKNKKDDTRFIGKRTPAKVGQR